MTAPDTLSHISGRVPRSRRAQLLNVIDTHRGKRSNVGSEMTKQSLQLLTEFAHAQRLCHCRSGIERCASQPGRVQQVGTSLGGVVVP